MSSENWLSSALFEHGCKENFSEIIKHSLDDPDLLEKVKENSVAAGEEQKPAVKPLFMLIYILKKINALHSFSYLPNALTSSSMLSIITDLLETVYKQYQFMSLKRFFTLISELKLLDLLQLIVNSVDSKLTVQKLNHHFPRWTSSYQETLEASFKVECSEDLKKVEESHTSCRRLILKIAVDKAYKTKYMSQQYENDLNRLNKETKEHLSAAINCLESLAGCSALEKIVDEDSDFEKFADPASQLLLDYIQPGITEEALLKFVDDLEPIMSSQQNSCLMSCLRPFDSMSDHADENSGISGSDSDYEEAVGDEDNKGES